MAVINFTKDFYKSNMPLYHEKSDRIYAIPQEVYRSLCEKHGGVLHSNAPDLVLDCYSIKATGDGII